MTLTSKLYTLQVQVSPSTDGQNTVHLFAFGPTGGPIVVKQWTGKAALPAQGIEGLDIPLLGITESHAAGEVTLPSAGTWRFSFTVRTTDIDQATVTTDIVVRGS